MIKITTLCCNKKMQMSHDDDNKLMVKPLQVNILSLDEMKKEHLYLLDIQAELIQRKKDRHDNIKQGRYEIIDNDLSQELNNYNENIERFTSKLMFMSILFDKVLRWGLEDHVIIINENEIYTWETEVYDHAPLKPIYITTNTE
jgi:hypothetical protein